MLSMVQPREHQLGHSDVEATTCRLYSQETSARNLILVEDSTHTHTHTHVRYTKRQKKLTNMIISFFWFRRPRDLRLVPSLPRASTVCTAVSSWSIAVGGSDEKSISRSIYHLFPWLHPGAAARSELWQSTYCTQNADRQSAGRSQVWDCVSIESRTASRPEAAESWTNIEVRAQVTSPCRVGGGCFRYCSHHKFSCCVPVLESTKLQDAGLPLVSTIPHKN